MRSTHWSTTTDTIATRKLFTNTMVRLQVLRPSWRGKWVDENGRVEEGNRRVKLQQINRVNHHVVGRDFYPRTKDRMSTSHQTEAKLLTRPVRPRTRQFFTSSYSKLWMGIWSWEHVEIFKFTRGEPCVWSRRSLESFKLDSGYRSLFLSSIFLSLYVPPPESFQPPPFRLGCCTFFATFYFYSACNTNVRKTAAGY